LLPIFRLALLLSVGRRSAFLPSPPRKPKNIRANFVSLSRAFDYKNKKSGTTFYKINITLPRILNKPLPGATACLML
jgi:hypothetical protein